MNGDRFSEFNRFGDRVRAELDQGERSAQKFKYLIGVISQTLVATHRIVLGRLAALERVNTAEEARDSLEAIRNEQLSEAFRVEGLCDALEGLGSGLRQRTFDARSEGLFSEEDLSNLEVFADMLYDRESEVAAVYADSLVDITEMAAGLDDATLPILKERTRELERLLTSQVSDFRAKSDRFMSVAE